MASKLSGFILFLGTCALVAPLRAETETRQLHAAPGTPIIDGEIETIWQQTPVANTDRIVIDNLLIPIKEASRANFRCLWDAKHLYVLAEVLDANLADENDAAWEQDSVEFFVDENFGRTNGYESNDGQFRINFRGDVSYGQSTNARINAVAKITPTGYLVEAAIPLRSIEATNGTKMGFEVQVNNDAGKGIRSSISKWNDPTNNSWHDTSGFGTLTLSSRDNVRPYDPQPANNGTPKENKSSASQRVPDWARDAVFYQIFPERFCNGDPDNDPTRESLEFPEVVPESWKVTPWTSDWYARADWEKQMGASFYEDGVFHRRYGGDLQGVINRLDYLAELGINTIYFNPVFYARSLHKYDGNSFHHIDPHFGPDPDGDFELMAKESDDPKTWNWTKADKLFLELIKKAHARNIRVIIDGVFNHTGRDFWAFADIAKNQQESPYLDWYTVQQFDDPATDANEFKYACWWGVDTLPEFANNADGTDLHPKPKAYVFQSTQRWMDPNNDGDPGDGIDGWRLDVANEVPNQFWRDWNQEVRNINPAAFTVAEIWDEAGDYLADCGFSSTMNYHGFAFPVKGFLIDGKMSASDFAHQLVERMKNHPPEVQFALQNLVDSHDTDRLASMIVNASHQRPYKNAGRFDYDVGERVSPRHFKDYDVASPTEEQRKLQKLVLLFQFTFVGPPMIYYGTEAGMDGADDPDDRLPMVWPDLEYEPRKMGPYGQLDKASKVSFDTDLHQYYQQIIKFRTTYPALCRGDFKILASDDEQQTVAFQRSYNNQSFIIAVNRSDKDISIEVPTSGSSLVPELVSDGQLPEPAKIVDETVKLPLAPHTGCVWRVVNE